jgi:hypothetical protein
MMVKLALIASNGDFHSQVWPNHRANLILMERYHFFTSSTRQFGMKSPSLANAHRDESESEGTLAMTLNTLRHVHRGFFHSNATQVNDNNFPCTQFMWTDQS